MNELYLAGLVLGSLLIPALTPLKFNERKTTEIFTGARPMKLYGSVNVHTLFEEFRKEAKKIWDAQPDDAKNIGDVFYEMYNGSKNGKLSTQLERMIDIETHRDSGFLTKQTIISLQPELNEHVSEKLKINQKISEIAERLEVTKPDVRNWILRYELDKEKYEKNPHYYYYADSIREGKGLPDPPSELIYDRKIPEKFETNISVMDQSNQRGNFIEKEIQNAPIPINIKHIEQPLRQSSNQNKIEKINVTLPKNVQSIKSDKPYRDNKIKPGNKNENSPIEKRNKIESINPSNIQLKSKDDLEIKNTKAPLNIPVKSPGVRFQNPPKSEQRWNSPQTKRSSDLGHSSFEGGNNPHQYTLKSMGIDSINHIDSNSFIKINKRAKNMPRFLPSTSLWSRLKKLFKSKYKVHVNTFKNSTKWLSNSKNDSGKSKKQNSKTKQKQYNDDIITQILDYLIEGKSVKWISKVTGVDIDFIRDTEKKLDSTTDKRTSGREKNTEHHKYQKVVIEPKVIREFHGLEQLPLCCDLPLDRELREKIFQLPTELQSELSELLEYGFQPFAMKDWMTKEILSEITDRDPNLLRDERFRKSKFDFRDPSSWGDILKGSGEFHISWKEGKYALLHEVFFSAFYNRVLTEAEDYLHHSFTRDHPKLKGFVREVIEFLDNKFDPEENHGRIVVDTSALTEIYSATMNAKLQSFMIYLTHDIKFDKAREILKNSTTFNYQKGISWK